MTFEELKAKVEWEGGVYEAIDYGLTTGDLPMNAPLGIQEDWAEVEKATEAIGRIEQWLNPR